MLGSESAVGLHPAHDVGSAHGAGLARDFASRFEDDECRNTADLVTGRRCLVLFRIQLRQPYGWFQLGSRLFERWRHHLAGPAPRRPEIDDDRNVTAADVGLEVRVGEFYRVAGKQRCAAFATAGAFRKTCMRYPVYRCAVRTDNVYRLSHFWI